MKVRYSISEKWDPKILPRIVDAIHFAVEYFDISDDRAVLTMKLITGKPDDQSATCARMKNRRYEIRLNYSRLQNNEKVVLKALFHELTHVKQFIKNGFRIRNGGMSGKWEGKLYECKDYWFSPWEMEARAMEDPLFNKFEESH